MDMKILEKISTSRWKKWVLRWVHIGLKKGKNIVINLCWCGCTIKFFSRSKRFNLFLFFKKYIHPPKISFIFDFEITLCECWSEVKKRWNQKLRQLYLQSSSKQSKAGGEESCSFRLHAKIRKKCNLG